jgi:glutaredoxin
MLEDDKFEYVDGKNSSKELTVYALSTCGFCRRALKFLKDNSIKFRFVYVDNLPKEVKENIKTGLREKFNDRIAYPFAVINDERHLVGFIEEEWKGELGIS